MIEPALSRSRPTGRETDPNTAAPEPYKRTSDHLANERTHLAYMRTAIALISLGVTINRFSIYLQQHDELPSRPTRELLGGTASAGFGMVVYALVLMLLALHRYRAVDEAIDRGVYHPDRPIVELLTVSVVIGAAAGILWMFRG
jgi:putative membrane protein